MIDIQTIGLICIMIALGIVLSVPIKAILFKFDDEKDLKSDKKD
jgi:hypothetical protein